MEPRTTRPLGRILMTVVLTFFGYATIGLPLAVLPTFVTQQLGFGAAVAGATVSVQYIATVLSRSQVGRMSDAYGPKRGVLWGFSICLVAGALTFVAGLLPAHPAASLGLLLTARLALGFAESWVSTSAITWAIGEVGPENTATIISWNGIATYGALAAGAPAGVLLASRFGFPAIGVATAVLAVIGLALAIPKRPVAVLVQKRLGQRSVIARILPYGCLVALGASGFGVIAAFVALFFAHRGWGGASLALTLFGLGFIAARLLLGRTIHRYGGLRVTLACFTVESAGLLLLWLAPNPVIAALAAGVAGFGFSPIFPALGVEAVSRVPPQNRGAAIGLYSVFMDVSLGITGPVAGLLLQRFGAASPFALGAAATLAGLAITAALLAR